MGLTRISIALAIVLIGGVASMVAMSASLTTKVEAHIIAPLIHENIVDRLNEDYVPRNEYEATLKSMQLDIHSIKIAVGAQ